MLRQISLPQASIVNAVRRFRELAEGRGATSLHLARRQLGDEYQQMVDQAEVTIAAQPLPRLQTVGTAEADFPFIYDLAWGPREHFTIRRLRAAGPRGLEVPLRPGAGDELVRLAPLIRPLIELHWTRMVAQLNDVARTEENLRRHLFGSERPDPPASLRAGIADLQAGRCFYCGDRARCQTARGPLHPSRALRPRRRGELGPGGCRLQQRQERPIAWRSTCGCVGGPQQRASGSPRGPRRRQPLGDRLGGGACRRALYLPAPACRRGAGLARPRAGGSGRSRCCPGRAHCYCVTPVEDDAVRSIGRLDILEEQPVAETAAVAAPVVS